MNYILIGFLLSIGWHLATVIYDVVSELLFSRLHKAKWYRVVAGKETNTGKDKPGSVKTVKNRIGF